MQLPKAHLMSKLHITNLHIRHIFRACQLFCVVPGLPTTFLVEIRQQAQSCTPEHDCWRYMHIAMLHAAFPSGLAV